MAFHNPTTASTVAEQVVVADPADDLTDDPAAVDAAADLGAEEHVVAVGGASTDADLRAGETDVGGLVLRTRVRATGHPDSQRVGPPQRRQLGESTSGTGGVGDADGADGGAGAGTDVDDVVVAEQSEAPHDQRGTDRGQLGECHVTQHDVLVPGEHERTVGVALGEIRQQLELGSVGVAEGERRC